MSFPCLTRYRLENEGTGKVKYEHSIATQTEIENSARKLLVSKENKEWVVWWGKSTNILINLGAKT